MPNTQPRRWRAQAMPHPDSTTSVPPLRTADGPEHAPARNFPGFQGFRGLPADCTPTPDQYFDQVVGRYHPCVERVIAILIRATLGREDPDTGERRLEAALPLSAFVRPELSRSSARKGLAGAIEAGVVVETLAATNREAARYALRWEDAEAQAQAIARQRGDSSGDRRPGAAAMEPKWKARRRGGDDPGALT